MGPRDNCVEDEGCAEHDGEFVEPCGQATPLFDVREPALDDIAALVAGRVERGRAAAAGPAALSMLLLIARLWDHGADAAGAQILADRARRVRLIGPDRVRSGAGLPDRPGHAQPPEQRQQGRRITGLPGGEGDHQRQAMTVDELVNLRRQTAPRAAQGVIRRFGKWIRVIRPSPL